LVFEPIALVKQGDVPPHIEGDEVARWGLEEPGFLLLCDQCGRVLINPGSADWEDVAFIRRGD
jgi:hypothetical protein